ncbi:hypothetical protein [Aquipuribacter sp. MA13-6]|uniref:hypothetical protein n=1 Tax=unclassified Aquipuribacter TaxID=2635084 RepID=UPI003EEF61EB
MSTGRPPGQGVLWALEVVPATSPEDPVVSLDDPGTSLDDPVTCLVERRATAEVARLFDVAAREPEALQQLDGCVALLREVQAAKTALTRLSPDQLRAGLAQRRQILTSDTA